MDHLEHYKLFMEKKALEEKAEPKSHYQRYRETILRCKKKWYENVSEEQKEISFLTNAFVYFAMFNSCVE